MFGLRRCPPAQIVPRETELRELGVDEGIEEIAEALVTLGIGFVVPLLQPRQVSCRTTKSGVNRSGGQPSCSMTSAEYAATAWQSSRVFQPTEATGRVGSVSRLTCGRLTKRSFGMSRGPRRRQQAGFWESAEWYLGGGGRVPISSCLRRRCLVRMRAAAPRVWPRTRPARADRCAPADSTRTPTCARSPSPDTYPSRSAACTTCSPPPAAARGGLRLLHRAGEHPGEGPVDPPGRPARIEARVAAEDPVRAKESRPNLTDGPSGAAVVQ